ncbi:MAG: tetratricopeptide repeat protein [Kofleriaceae bacterium]|nr:tetratricopeptide repeat protein [Kofleriaceae bacterium]
MRPALVASLLALTAAAAACGSGPRPRAPAPPAQSDVTTGLAPADDLAGATPPTGAGAGPTGTRAGTGQGSGTPHYDLEEIRLTATAGGDVVATAPSQLLDDAKAALDAGRTREAIALYRQLAADFPTSRLAPAALFNIGVIHENLGDVRAAIVAYHDVVAAFPVGRESLDAHLRAAGLEAEHEHWRDAERTLREVLARPDLSHTDRIEAHARLGYVLLEQGRHADARAALDAAVAAWRKATRVDDRYYIAMAHYYLGELAHREFLAVQLRSADTMLKADLVAKERLAAEAYDRWRQALEMKQPYWALAAGYRMSHVFLELWETAVRAPMPDGLDPAARDYYRIEVHDRVRRHLHTALDGHEMNVKLAAAYGVDNAWSAASKVRAAAIAAILARESRGELVVPPASAPQAR